MRFIHCVYGYSGVDDSKISVTDFAHCVDTEDKFYTFCTLCLRVLFTFHI